ALRRNARRLVETLGGAELWAVVKADGYGHGALDCGRAALDAGATALCVATVAEALALRRELRQARILVMGPVPSAALPTARAARLERAVGDDVPDGIPVHLKLDTGMGRWGAAELAAPGRDVVGVMTHLATADSDPAFALTQLERFRAATADLPEELTRHAANSAAALRIPESRLDAARAGIALYGLSPFGTSAPAAAPEPVLSWPTELAPTPPPRPGDPTGYGRRYTAAGDTWIGIVPVGYADGFRRDLTGTEILVAGERRPAVGTVSMDA